MDNKYFVDGRSFAPAGKTHTETLELSKVQ